VAFSLFRVHGPKLSLRYTGDVPIVKLPARLEGCEGDAEPRIQSKYLKKKEKSQEKGK